MPEMSGKDLIKHTNHNNMKVIAMTAHKLLPIASMMQMDCLPQLTALSPEHIQEQEAQKIREYVQAAINDLQHILGEILSV